MVNISSVVQIIVEFDIGVKRLFDISTTCLLVSELAVVLGLYFARLVATHHLNFRLFSSEVMELSAHFFANLRMILGKTHA